MLPSVGDKLYFIWKNEVHIFEINEIKILDNRRIIFYIDKLIGEDWWLDFILINMFQIYSPIITIGITGRLIFSEKVFVNYWKHVTRSGQ